MWRRLDSPGYKSVSQGTLGFQTSLGFYPDSSHQAGIKSKDIQLLLGCSVRKGIITWPSHQRLAQFDSVQKVKYIQIFACGIDRQPVWNTKPVRLYYSFIQHLQINKHTSTKLTLYIKLVYINGNNAAEGENNIKYASNNPIN